MSCKPVRQFAITKYNYVELLLLHVLVLSGQHQGVLRMTIFCREIIIFLNLKIIQPDQPTGGPDVVCVTE